MSEEQKPDYKPPRYAPFGECQAGCGNLLTEEEMEDGLCKFCKVYGEVEEN